ncbi:MAG TPA: TonB-dependent receptor, partial [Rhizomicrobium sp.]|nr:TonB-dependent receptor [Rhizomicrobium sp.]
AAPFVSYQYNPEYVWDYEGFVRASLLDSQVTLTANVFYNTYKDLQLPFALSALSTVIRNAERATTYGAEATAHYRPMHMIDLFASIGLLQTRVDRSADPSLQGNDLARSPAFTSSVGFNVTPWQKLMLNADLRYTDAYYSDATSTARGRTKPHALVNAQVSYSFDVARVFVATRNLFDSRAAIAILPGATAALDAVTITEPRTFTIGIEKAF